MAATPTRRPPPGATPPRQLSTRALLHSAFLGYCPNCLLGKLFTGLLRPRRSCSVCGMAFEHQGGTFTMTAFILYLLVCFALTVEGVALAMLFGFFPGFTALLGASALALLLLLHRPVRGLWVWCLWRLGYLG